MAQARRSSARTTTKPTRTIGGRKSKLGAYDAIVNSTQGALASPEPPELPTERTPLKQYKKYEHLPDSTSHSSIPSSPLSSPPNSPIPPSSPWYIPQPTGIDNGAAIEIQVTENGQPSKEMTPKDSPRASTHATGVLEIHVLDDPSVLAQKTSAKELEAMNETADTTGETPPEIQVTDKILQIEDVAHALSPEEVNGTIPPNTSREVSEQDVSMPYSPEDDFDELDHTTAMTPAGKNRHNQEQRPFAPSRTHSSTSSKRKRSASVESSTTPSGRHLPSVDTTQSTRPEKRTKDVKQAPIKLDEDDFNPPYTPMSKEELNQWKGWLDVESEPENINVILRELGVRGVTSSEVIGLELAMETLQPPIYGLVFCFQYQDSDYSQENTECPKELWFSNQLPATNACLSIALLNILLNANKIDLGRSLSYFKEDTTDLSSMERAHCLNEHEQIRQVHNSVACATKMDTWIADRNFATKHKNQVQIRKKQIRDEERAAEKKAREAATPLRGSLKPKRTPKSKKYDDEASPEPDVDYEDDNAYHYVAYVPVQGSIWKLDGMSKYPTNLCEYSHIDSWLFDVAPFIQARMQEHERGNNFNLMALVKDPATIALDGLAENVRRLHAIEAKLDRIGSDWRSYTQELSCEVVAGVSVPHNLTQELIDAAKEADLSKVGDSMEKLLEMRSEAIKDQAQHRECIEVQNVKRETEELNTKKARLDLNPTIHKILLGLEENGVAAELLDIHRA